MTAQGGFSKFIIPMGVIAVLGIGLYLLYKHGAEFFGNLFGNIGINLTGDVGRGIAQGAETGGVAGAVGGGIYETFVSRDTTLRETIIERIADTGEDYVKAGVDIVAEDIHAGPFDSGFLGAIIPPFSGFTIGAGLAAIGAWGGYLEGLPEEERRVERWGEFERRAKWMEEHPIETAIGFPAHIIHTFIQPGMMEAPQEVLGERIKELHATPTTKSRTELAGEYQEEITRRREAKEIPPRQFAQPAPSVRIAKRQPEAKEIQKIVTESPIMETPIGQMIKRDLISRFT